MKRRTAYILMFIGLVLLLAACQDPVPTFTYEGTSTVAGVAQPLTLSYEQRGALLTGEYQVTAAKGSFRGTLDGTTVIADLTPGAACTYTFEGALIETRLTGEFEPTGCLGGESGAWSLDLR